MLLLLVVRVPSTAPVGDVMVPLERVHTYCAPVPALATVAVLPVDTAVTMEAVEIIAPGSGLTSNGVELLLEKAGGLQVIPPLVTEISETVKDCPLSFK